jgi:hypothetical protein
MSNLSNLDPKLVEKMTELDKKFNPVQQQLTALQDIASMVHELVNLTDDTRAETSQLKAIGAVLDDSRQQLVELNKKEAPESPDYAKPVVVAVEKLSRELSAQLAKIDVKPEVKVAAPSVNVDAPQVNVAAPEVTIDLTKIEKLLKNDLPKAFDKAIAQIPAPDPQDDTLVIEQLQALNKILQDVDRAVRLKPVFPNQLQIVNAPGTTIDTSLKNYNTIKFATISATNSGDNQVLALVASKSIKVLSCALVASGTVSVKWRSNTTDLSGAMPLIASSGFVYPASAPGMGNYLETNIGEALNLNLSGAVAVYGHISYYEG